MRIQSEAQHCSKRYNLIVLFDIYNINYQNKYNLIVFLVPKAKGARVRRFP
jgi:hypothetical protein